MSEIALDNSVDLFLADTVDILGIHPVVFGTEEFERYGIRRPADLLERLEDVVERDAARARPDAILVEQGADGEVLRVVQMNDEDLLAVCLREILKARTHAVEMEAVDVRPTLSLSTS